MRADFFFIVISVSRSLAIDFGLGPGANEIGKNTDVLSEIGKN